MNQKMLMPFTMMREGRIKREKYLRKQKCMNIEFNVGVEISQIEGIN